MSRVSSTAKRYTSPSYTSPSYTSHYGSYTSSLAPSLGSYSERDRFPYKGSSSSYLGGGGSSSRIRNYSSTSEPDRGRPIPRADLLGGRRSESLSRAPVKSYGSGLSGGYSGYSHSPAQSSYTSTSTSSSSACLSRRRSVSQSDLTRDLASLGLSDPLSSSSSSSSGLKPPYRSRGSEGVESYSCSRYSSGAISGHASTRLNSSWERERGTSRYCSPTRDSPARRTALPLPECLLVGNLVAQELFSTRLSTKVSSIYYIFSFWYLPGELTHLRCGGMGDDV